MTEGNEPPETPLKWDKKAFEGVLLQALEQDIKERGGTPNWGDTQHPEDDMSNPDAITAYLKRVLDSKAH